MEVPDATHVGHAHARPLAPWRDVGLAPNPGRPGGAERARRRQARPQPPTASLPRLRRSERRRCGLQVGYPIGGHPVPGFRREEGPEEARVEDVLASHDAVPLEGVVGSLEHELADPR
jgi:hypothetical protein